MEKQSIQFLRDSLIHHRDVKNALDQKASILLGVGGVIFTLSISRLEEMHFMILAVVSFLTVLLSVLVIRLPYRGIKESEIGLMCWWSSNRSFREYEKELKAVFKSDEKISKEYMKEIYNLVNYSIKPKGKLLTLATIILTSGLLVGFLLFFV